MTAFDLPPKTSAAVSTLRISFSLPLSVLYRLLISILSGSSFVSHSPPAPHPDTLSAISNNLMHLFDRYSLFLLWKKAD